MTIAGLRCEFGGHLPISSKKCPRPIQVVLGGSYAFLNNKNEKGAPMVSDRSRSWRQLAKPPHLPSR